jgi:hypothetical protein
VLAELAAWMQAEGADLLAAWTGGGGGAAQSDQLIASPLERSDGNCGFSRYWIYSHHIYSRAKRRDLQQLALEHRLTGFCHPGKPGVICVEVSVSGLAIIQNTLVILPLFFMSDHLAVRCVRVLLYVIALPAKDL